MRAARFLRNALVVIALSAMFVGCGSAAPTPPAHTPSSATPSPTPSPTASPTPAPSAPPLISVTGSAAFATNDGTLGVVVLHNADSRSATGVHVTITAVSSNGQGPVTGTATLAGLGSGETRAVGIALSVPSNDDISGVSATATADASGAYANPASAGAAQFTTADFQPEVILPLTNSSATPLTVQGIAVCYDANGKIIGGGTSQPLTLAASQTRSAQFAVSALDTPEYCKGYANPDGLFALVPGSERAPSGAHGSGSATSSVVSARLNRWVSARRSAG